MYEYTHLRDSRPRHSLARHIGWALSVVLLCVSPCVAQLEVGENLKMTLDGSFGFGYGGGWGSRGDSNRSIHFMGSGGLNGYYYHPNFLSFNALPHYNRTKNDGTSETVLNSNGVSGSVNLFTGSLFPGSISFGKEFNSTSEFGIPGLSGLNTEGTSQNFGITWSALLPNLPSLTASYTSSSSSSSILGLSSDAQTSTRNLNLDSRYQLRGYRLAAYYNRQGTTNEFPDLWGTGITENSGANSTLGVSVSHQLPLSGSFSAQWSQSNFSNDQDGGRETSAQNASVTANISPFRRLSISADVRYMGNMFTQLQRNIIDAGGTPVLTENDARSTVFTSMAYLSIGRGLALNGHVTHRIQNYYGREVSDTQYGGNLNYRYARPLFGMIYFSFGLVDNANKYGNSNLGFSGSVGFSRRFGRWETSSDFSYSQNVQTQVAWVTTSSYSYGAFVRRKLTPYVSWHATSRFVHSGLTQREGDLNRSETLATGLRFKSYGFSVSYSQSHGRSVLTPSGLLTPEPLPPELFGDDFVIYDGRSYSVTGYTNPIKKMTITGHYTKIKSDTLSRSFRSLNDGDRYNAQLEYRLRKMSLRAGFTRTEQFVLAGGNPRAVVNSYYFGLSRWFNVF